MLISCHHGFDAAGVLRLTLSPHFSLSVDVASKLARENRVWTLRASRAVVLGRGSQFSAQLPLWRKSGRDELYARVYEQRTGVYCIKTYQIEPEHHFYGAVFIKPTGSSPTLIQMVIPRPTQPQ